MRTKATYVKDLTVDELRVLIQQTVEAVLDEYLPDPDAGRTLKPEVEQQLRESLKQTQAGKRGIPMEEVLKKLELDG